MRLILIAHAATTATRSAAFGADESIEAREHARAAKLARPAWHAATALSSPARAALETAAAMGLEAIADPQLADMHAGRWRGRTVNELAAAEPAALARWTQNPYSAPHGGESLAVLRRRVGIWLDAQDEASPLTVAVTHAAVLRAAIVHALDAPAEAIFAIDAGPLTVVELSRSSRMWRLQSLTKPRGAAEG
jgi:broad specificity phosphatase PhoE